MSGGVLSLAAMSASGREEGALSLWLAMSGREEGALTLWLVVSGGSADSVVAMSDLLAAPSLIAG